MELKNQLKFWFTVHFVIDVISALFLFIIPTSFLRLAGWESIDLISARLVAAAIFAVAGIGISIIQNSQGRPPAAYIILGIFICFNILWTYYLIKVRKA